MENMKLHMDLSLDQEKGVEVMRGVRSGCMLCSEGRAHWHGERWNRGYVVFLN